MKPRALGKERGNMKEWAEWFYKSKEWAQTRDAYMVAQHYLCERCGEPAKIVETIIDRAKATGLPLAKDAFRETKENPLPEPPYLVYIVPQVVGRGSDERILLHEIHAALELYTDKVADGSLEKEIEEKVLFDVDYTKYQDTIESEDMVQTAYEFTIYEKVKKKG